MTALDKYPIYSGRKASRGFRVLHTLTGKKMEARLNYSEKWPHDYLQPASMHSPSLKKW